MPVAVSKSGVEEAKKFSFVSGFMLPVIFSRGGLFSKRGVLFTREAMVPLTMGDVRAGKAKERKQSVPSMF